MNYIIFYCTPIYCILAALGFRTFHHLSGFSSLLYSPSVWRFLLRPCCWCSVPVSVLVGIWRSNWRFPGFCWRFRSEQGADLSLFWWSPGEAEVFILISAMVRLLLMISASFCSLKDLWCSSVKPHITTHTRLHDRAGSLTHFQTRYRGQIIQHAEKLDAFFLGRLLQRLYLKTIYVFCLNFGPYVFTVCHISHADCLYPMETPSHKSL